MKEVTVTYSETVVYTAKVLVESIETADEEFTEKFYGNRNSLVEQFSHCEDLAIVDITENEEG